MEECLLQSDRSLETSYVPLESRSSRHRIFAFFLLFLLCLNTTVGNIFLASSSALNFLCWYGALPALPTVLSQFFWLYVDTKQSHLLLKGSWLLFSAFSECRLYDSDTLRLLRSRTIFFFFRFLKIIFCVCAHVCWFYCLCNCVAGCICSAPSTLGISELLQLIMKACPYTALLLDIYSLLLRGCSAKIADCSEAEGKPKWNSETERLDVLPACQLLRCVWILQTMVQNQLLPKAYLSNPQKIQMVLRCFFSDSPFEQ